MDLRETIDYITGQIEHVCKAHKDRSAGTASEYQCQQHLGEQLSAWSDSVHEDEFTLRPHAFLGWLSLASILIIGAICMYWLRHGSNSIIIPIIGVVAALFSMLMAVFEYLLYFRFVDFLFPRRRSHNLLATRKPTGEIKRRIIFGGHADAAYEMTYSFHGGEKNIFRILIGAIIGMLFVLGVNTAVLITTLSQGPVPIVGIWRLLGFMQIAFVPVFVDLMLFINWRCVVDGANDNLSGCLVAMGVLREMERRDMRCEQTEVCCLITGSEEAGLRGARAFVKKHREDLVDVQTVFIALDTLRECEQLMIYTQGINGMQRNSPHVAELLLRAGERCGIKMRTAGFYPGATDAEAFSRGGVLACGLCGVSHTPQDYYHTRRDTHDNIDPRCLELSLRICLEAATIYDKCESIECMGESVASPQSLLIEEASGIK